MVLTSTWGQAIPFAHGMFALGKKSNTGRKKSNRSRAREKTGVIQSSPSGDPKYAPGPLGNITDGVGRHPCRRRRCPRVRGTVVAAHVSCSPVHTTANAAAVMDAPWASPFDRLLLAPRLPEIGRA